MKLRFLNQNYLKEKLKFLDFARGCKYIRYTATLQLVNMKGRGAVP